jgi:malonyl-CoA decarboxylase
MSTLFERGMGKPSNASRVPMIDLCTALLSPQGEVSGTRLAREVLGKYRSLDHDGRRDFFRYLATDLDLDTEAVAQAAKAYGETRDAANLAKLCREAEPRRQELLRRLNQATGATQDLVRMRLDLLGMIKDEPDLAVIDPDFRHLFASWFNRGFLVLRPIDWRTPANILEKIIEYEAVHAIDDWDDLQRRLRPVDRRCFAFFHPAMAEEPLIFVEVALTKGIAGSVQDLLAEERAALDEADLDTAVFYSISNCQAGLAGISFGNSLIKQVVEELKRDLPQVKRFVTLSPVPGFAGWLAAIAPDNAEAGELLRAAQTGDAAQIKPLTASLKRLCAYYLAEVKGRKGLPADPVARFHLSNGASLHDVHALADTSPNGLRKSCTAMVNYYYDLAKVEQNNESFVTQNKVTLSKQVKALVEQSEMTGKSS